MLSTAADGAIARNAEAARVNQGGLECSSYTWQVGQPLYGAVVSRCQEDLGLTSDFQWCLGAIKFFLNNGLSGQGGAVGHPSPRNKEGETSE